MLNYFCKNVYFHQEHMSFVSWDPCPPCLCVYVCACVFVIITDLILKATCLSLGLLLIALLNFYSSYFHFFCKFSVNTPFLSMQLLFLPMSFIFYLLSKGLQVTYRKRQRCYQNVNARPHRACCIHAVGTLLFNQPFPPSSHLVLTRCLGGLGSYNSPYTDVETEGPEGRSWCRSSQLLALGTRTAAGTSCTVNPHCHWPGPCVQQITTEGLLCARHRVWNWGDGGK